MTRPSKKTGSSQKRLSKWRVFLLSVLALITIGFLSLLIFVISAIAKTPEWDPAALTNQKQSSIIYDKDGNQVAQLHAQENRLTVESEDIPELVKQTFVAVEDKRFYQHHGIDPIRIVGAAITDIRHGEKREGASTITTQLAKNAFIENPTEKTLTRKLQEAALAVQIENKYTKDEILTFYLNKIYFGESAFGIRAASLTYFGKELEELNPGEIALLAGLPQAPSGYDPYVYPDNAKKRRNIVLGVMLDANLITNEEYELYKEEPFTYVESVQETGQRVESGGPTGVSYQYPYYVDYVIEELVSVYGLTEDQIFNGGLKIYTTLDPKIQTATEEAFADPANFPKGTEDMQVEGAMTILDPTTGAIRAMVGGREYTPRGLNRAWQSKRQPGSTIKPLTVYGPAIEKGGYYPGTVLDDMPVEYNAGNGKIWAPTDYDTETKGWKGLITMRYAVEQSVNVYAVKLLDLIGVEYGWKFGKDLLGLPLTEDDKVLSLALGTNRASTLDMASAYGVYANNGVKVTTHAVEKVLDSRDKEIASAQVTQQRVMKETTAYIMNDMLSGVVKNGTGYNARMGNWAVAGKTGTTSLPDKPEFAYKSGNPDAWFAGYTPNYVGVVWMGYDVTDKDHYLHKVYGGSYPAKIWKEVMTVAHEDLPVQKSFSKPSGIVSGTIDTKSGLLPSSLTPIEFTKTEIAAQGDFPTRVSDVWIEADVDADNPELLASPNTSNRLTKVFLNLPNRDPEVEWPKTELQYKMPTEYAPDPIPQPTTNPPAGDPTLPTVTLGPASYDASTGNVTMALNRAPESSQYAIVLYMQLPGETTLSTFTLQDPTGQAASISVPLGDIDNPPATGEYTFWAALQDPMTLITGAPSPGVKLNLKGQD